MQFDLRQMHRALVMSLLVACGLAAAQTTDGGSFNTPRTSSSTRTAADDEDAQRSGNDPLMAPNGTVGSQRVQPGQPQRQQTQQQQQQGSASQSQRNPQDAASSQRLQQTGSTRLTRPRFNEPVVLSEFQKFVEASTGRVLPVFGSQFFADAADSFAPGENIPVSADYLVSPGDEVIVRAWGSIDVDYRTTVDRNGFVNLPKVGSFSVAGVKASALEAQLRTQMSRLFTNFNLSVSLGQLRGVKVFVVGPAAKPGVYTLPSQSTLLSAAVAAGGPSANGSMRRILLRRDGKLLSEIDIYEFLVQGDKSRDQQLANGDVIVFQPVGARVAISGAIDTAAIFELKNAQESAGDVLRYAGGASVLANRNRVVLERVDPAQNRAKRFVEEFRLDAEGSRKMLRDGDLLALLPISPEFANAVTLKGHVAQPLRFPWKPGMRISDLIPDKDALISPDFYRRKNLLVQVMEPEPGQQSTTIKLAPAALFEELNWDYALIERLNKTDLTTKLIPFNLGRAVLQQDPTQDIELLAGDVVTVYSQKDIRVPVSRQTRLVSLEGEISAPGVYQLMPGETLKALLTRAGGFTPQAYIYGLDFSREETRVRQRENLAAATARLEALAATQSARNAANRRDDSNAAADAAVSTAATQAQIARLSRIQPNGRIALELDPAATSLDGLPDVPLENADRISVPARPGFVTVAGAVVNSNAFLWKPGRTAGDYVKLAGLDEGAEVSNMFILRADGTVSHAADARRFLGFGNGLQSQPLYPGDAVIVPNQLDYETWGRAFVRNLKDFSQIFSQFGLGAAAIKTLRD